MKKVLSICLSLLLCLLAAGCAGKAGSLDESGNSIAPAATRSNQKTAKEAIPDFVDLTAMSSTLVYAEVYNIMSSPGSYKGKTIKMRGLYQANYYESTKQYYHCVIIADAAACCQQGLEFVWAGRHKYPDDYPENGTEIEVTGVFGSYKELGQTYYHLTVDEITVLK